MPISFGWKSKVKAEREVPAVPLSPDCQLINNAGSRLIDVRDPEAFRAGFIPGSFNIPDLDCVTAAERSGLLNGREIYLLADDIEQLRLFRDETDKNLVGWFGPDALDEWKKVMRDVGTVEALNQEAFGLRVEAMDMLAIDVLDRGEQRSLSHPGALRFSLDDLPRGLDGLPAETRLCLTAQSVGIASYAASLVCNFGFHRVAYLDGGGLEERFAKIRMR